MSLIIFTTLQHYNNVTFSQEVLQAIKETDYKVIVTEYTFDPGHRKKLDAGYARLKKERIPFVIRPSRLTWLAIHQYSETGDYIPYNGDPKKAWDNCRFRHCTIIVGDKLYKCTHMLHVYGGSQNGILDAEVWKAALSYKPLTLESTSDEIVEHLRKREKPECMICFEKPIVVPARQLPLKK